MRILELDSDAIAFIRVVLALLFLSSDYKMLHSYSTGYVDNEGVIRVTLWDL